MATTIFFARGSAILRASRLYSQENLNDERFSYIRIFQDQSWHVRVRKIFHVRKAGVRHVWMHLEPYYLGSYWVKLQGIRPNDFIFKAVSTVPFTLLIAELVVEIRKNFLLNWSSWSNMSLHLHKKLTKVTGLGR